MISVHRKVHASVVKSSAAGRAADTANCAAGKAAISMPGRDGIIRQLEGGQMPLIRRLPKVGFRRKDPLVYQVVNLSALVKFESGAVVDAQALRIGLDS